MIETTDAYGFTFAYPAGDLVIGRCLRDYGEFGRVGATLAAQLAVDAVLIDVGANIGAYALPAARRAARVIAIEAQPSICELLQRNVAGSGLANIEVIAAAAGEASGEVAVPDPSLDERGNFGALSIGHWRGPTVQVPVVRLDDVAPPQTRVVKVDVEGYEPQVLAGAARLIDEVRPYWLVETSADTPQTRGVIDRFLGAGYRVWWVYDPFVTPRAPKRAWTPDEPGDFSVLAAPAEGPQPADMVEVRPPYAWPTSFEGFRYLTAFGLSVTPPPS